jgi:hypothetical protein
MKTNIMKKLKYYLGVFVLMALVFNSCQEDYEFGAIVAPSNINISTTYIDDDVASAAPGLGSGVVNFTATADNATSFSFVIQGQTKVQKSGAVTHNFTNLGLNTYQVTVIAYGTGGASSSQTIEVDVLALYEPPADLVQMLHGGTEKSWRMKAEVKPHFGLGPPDGFIPGEWYSAEPFEKAAVGMYDDRYVFKADGTFTHITNNTNDDPTVNPEGTVFGRINLIDQLGGSGGVVNGADVENLPYNDYTAQWTLTAPNDIETLGLSGTAFLGYYIGGNHQYQIIERSANEMIVKSVDGNGEFAWWFTLTTLEEGEDGDDFETSFTNLVWEDDFNTDGAPNPANWTYDLGTGTDGWGNGEVQTYTNDAANVNISDGTLKITAIKNGSDYTSARLKSIDLYEFKYGRVEVRAKLPGSQGTWPAIWMLGANFPEVGWPRCGEIDIMEQTGGDKNTSLGTYHWFDTGTNSNASYGETLPVANASSEFHLYGLEWTAEKLTILLDNVPVTVLDNNADLPFYDKDFFFILNVAMGGTLGGTIDPAFTQDTMEIDYVRVYQ